MESQAGSPALAILSPLLESNEALRRWLRIESGASDITFTTLLANLLVRELEIHRGLEGPQLVLTWKGPKIPSAIEKIVIVRKKYDYPITPTDGGGQKIVYDGPAADGFLTEIFPEIEPCRCYYYTVFTQLIGGETLYGPAQQVSEFAIETGFFAKKLMELLPDAYLISDKRLESEERQREVLTRAFDLASKEWFNLYEDGLKDKGSLARFLQVAAIELDILKGLIDCLPVMYDVDETCCEFLEAMATNIGLVLNTELSCTAQRKEIKNQVAIYKVKGTRQAIEARARATCELPTRVHEWCGNILISNRLDRTTLKSPNPGFAEHFRLPGDDTDYTPGQGIGFFRFTVFFLLDCDDCVGRRCVEKLNRVLPPEYPVCRIGELVFVDCRFVDEYDRARLDELFCEVLEEAAAVEDFRTHCWLIANRLPDAPALPGPSPTLPFERHLSNSIGAVTANPFRFCHERFFDVEEISDEFVEDLTDCWLIANRVERTSNSVRWRTPGAPRCMPVDDSFDQVQVGEFVEDVVCRTLGLMFFSNRPTGGLSGNPSSLTNTLQSLVAPCGGDFWWDDLGCLARVNEGRVNCSHVEEN